jgi:hypothetical protein
MYRVTNAWANNQSVKWRGPFSPSCPDGDLKSLFINMQPHVPGVGGRNPTCTNGCIELIDMFYRQLELPVRQMRGFMQEYWQLRGPDIAVPPFGQLSGWFVTLTMSVQYRCQRMAGCLTKDESIRLIVDTSG